MPSHKHDFIKIIANYYKCKHSAMVYINHGIVGPYVGLHIILIQASIKQKFNMTPERMRERQEHDSFLCIHYAILNHVMGVLYCQYHIYVDNCVLPHSLAFFLCLPSAAKCMRLLRFICPACDSYYIWPITPGHVKCHITAQMLIHQHLTHITRWAAIISNLDHLRSQWAMEAVYA